MYALSGAFSEFTVNEKVVTVERPYAFQEKQTKVADVGSIQPFGLHSVSVWVLNHQNNKTVNRRVG